MEDIKNGDRVLINGEDYESYSDGFGGILSAKSPPYSGKGTYKFYKDTYQQFRCTSFPFKDDQTVYYNSSSSKITKYVPPIIKEESKSTINNGDKVIYNGVECYFNNNYLYSTKAITKSAVKFLWHSLRPANEFLPFKATEYVYEHYVSENAKQFMTKVIETPKLSFKEKLKDINTGDTVTVNVDGEIYENVVFVKNVTGFQSNPHKIDYCFWKDGSGSIVDKFYNDIRSAAIIHGLHLRDTIKVLPIKYEELNSFEIKKVSVKETFKQGDRVDITIGNSIYKNAIYVNEQNFINIELGKTQLKHYNHPYVGIALDAGLNLDDYISVTHLPSDAKITKVKAIEMKQEELITNGDLVDVTMNNHNTYENCIQVDNLIFIKGADRLNDYFSVKSRDEFYRAPLLKAGLKPNDIMHARHKDSFLKITKSKDQDFYKKANNSLQNGDIVDITVNGNVYRNLIFTTDFGTKFVFSIFNEIRSIDPDEYLQSSAVKSKIKGVKEGLLKAGLSLETEVLGLSIPTNCEITKSTNQDFYKTNQKSIYKNTSPIKENTMSIKDQEDASTNSALINLKSDLKEAGLRSGTKRVVKKGIQAITYLCKKNNLSKAETSGVVKFFNSKAGSALLKSSIGNLLTHFPHEAVSENKKAQIIAKELRVSGLEEGLDIIGDFVEEFTEGVGIPAIMSALTSDSVDNILTKASEVIATKKKVRVATPKKRVVKSKEIEVEDADEAPAPKRMSVSQA